MFSFTVEVRDKTLARVGQILPEDLNLTISDTFNNVGTWTLVIANGHPMVPALRTPGAGIVVTRTDLGTVLMSGPVDSPSLDVSASAPAGMVTITGMTDSVVLADRLSYPQPSNSDATSQAAANDVRTGTAEDLMFAYVDANIGPSAQAPNLMTGDASTFETSGGGWVNSVNGPVARSTAQAHSGTASLSTTATAAATIDIASCSAATITTNGKAVAPGDTVAVSTWTRAATTGRSVGIAAQFYDASGVNVGTLFGTRVTNTTTGWTQITATVTAPAAAAYFRILVEITSPAATEVHYIDDVTAQRNYGRRDLRLTLGTNSHRGDSLTKSPRFQALGPLLGEIASVANYPTGTYRPLGFRVAQVGSTLQFQTYATADKSLAVRFDIDNGTLASSKVATAAPNVTRTIVAGQGDGTARKIVEVTNATSLTAESAWSRRIEEFIDQRQTNDPNELTAAGNEALANGGLSQFAMQLTPGNDTAWVYGVDYSLGDLVTVVIRTGGTDPLASSELVTQVTGWVLKADSSGTRFGALLGQPSSDQIAEFSARLSNLERNGAGVALGSLTDVALSGPSQYDMLQVNASGKWVNTNVLRLGSSLTAAVVNTARASATDDGYASSAIGDTNGRFFIDMSGRQRWGSGSGSTDTFLSRASAGVLKAEGDFLVAGNLTGAGAPMQRQIFTANGTWTKPANAKWVRIVCVGGGGGGGGTSASIPTGQSAHAGGGQAGSYSESFLTASTFGTSVTVTIGAGGAGQSGGTNGSNGGTTSFGSAVTAPGGIGGQNGGTGSTAVYGTVGGFGAAAGTGQIATAGAPGGFGFGGPALGIGGMGASSPFGGGGGSANTTTSGTANNGGNASGYGGGGGGGAGSQNAASSSTGGSGSGGLVIVDTYF